MSRYRAAGWVAGFLCLGWAAQPAESAEPSRAELLRVSVDLAQTREPMSKYIYSQFIEHLGRCIYGGIWSEMLEDRKFFHPVGSADSPWKLVGGDGAVTMSTRDAFVGEHTPQIAGGGQQGGPRGLVQPGLGILQGRSYTGHIWLRSRGKPSAVVVRLAWGSGMDEGTQVRLVAQPYGYTKHALSFVAQANTDDARLEIVTEGTCLVGTVSLMPADNVRGMRADTLQLLKQLAAPIYRWPGGNFVSGYDWRDGIGDRDRRPPRKNPAWEGIDSNDFGIDEFLDYCREVQAEPLIVVNTGFGDAYSAAQEVAYVNGSADTLGGSWRVKNGHRAPYDVRWWGVGNEMYGPWQLGYMQLNQYTRKHNLVAAAMREVDPTIQLIGVGALDTRSPLNPKDQRNWSEAMLAECAETIDLISEHFYCGAKDDVVEHVRQIPQRIREKAEGHRELRRKLPQLQGRDIRIALDEWNYWHRPYVYGELGCIYHLRDALGIAAGLHEYSRNTDIIAMAQYAQTVNVIGCIKTTKTAAAFDTTGLVLMLYRHHFGQVPVAVSSSAADSPLDIAASLRDDRRTLSLAVVNPLATPQQFHVDTQHGQLGTTGLLWLITGAGPMAYNEPGKPPQVSIEERAAEFTGTLSVPAYSVSLYEFPLATP